MSIIKDKFTLRKTFQVIAGLLGVIAALIGIYAFFFQDDKVQINFEVLANTNVLDINEDINKLDITYANNSLKSNNQSLRIINLRIKNTGDKSILKSFYDNNDPISAYITKGKIIEKPELIAASNQYIKKNIRIKLDSTGIVSFNDLIIEPGEFYTIKLLILHKTGYIPKLHASGKIAGIKNITVISYPQESNEQSFLQTTFKGNFYVQLFRGISYTIGFLLFISILVLIIAGIISKIEKRKRIKICKSFQRIHDYTPMEDIIFQKFEDNDNISFFTSDLIRYEDLLKDENRLNQKHNNWMTKFNDKDEDEFEDKKERFIFKKNKSEWKIIQDLINNGYAIKDKNDRLIVNQPLFKSLQNFNSYVENYNKKD